MFIVVNFEVGKVNYENKKIYFQKILQIIFLKIVSYNYNKK